MFWKRSTNQPKESSPSASDVPSAVPAVEPPLIDDLRSDLDEALRWLARNARGELRGVSRFLHDLAKALYKAGLTNEATTVVAEARKLFD